MSDRHDALAVRADRVRPRTRRDVLRCVALAAVAVPLAAACGPGYAEGPDDLVPLRDQARADAESAAAIAGTGAAQSAALARQVAEVRSAHADALQAEIDRENRPAAESPARTAPASADLAGLGSRLDTARAQAAALVPAQPRHRASLLASVAAGCAAAQQLSDELGGGSDPGVDPAAAPVPSGTLPPETADALQRALTAEHAAVWVYGLVSAFLPGDYTAGVADGASEHRDRRDALERILNGAGATPVAPEAAYLPPKPVTDEQTAAAVVATAETDAATAWRGVLDGTDDGELRTVAMRALMGSASRGTAWRGEAGLTPAAIALPGRTAV
ncbi:hypothetical protein CFN78_04430 [Amycolatopsis antarctica]|uniref:DUF4439 domain-containing protein n=1 Tax=Amycolatopsis antarctica TaxID=1854586 RepID=A0A263D7M5_9PSEU|nr:ferritin-like domain-containing protein [Amycolatopsis antarctica]OZM74381.1 hypothetical protein CFN78_04430 [Amycolatopsis antarctica]